MSIRYVEGTKQFILETAETCYQMKVDGMGYLQHLYYGGKTGQSDMSYPFRLLEYSRYGTGTET